ncbi:hypothetical protein GDO81_015548 [Engystomops pustulosus]|uniref:Uncharacterized protein n=1 Tax=Engystomops pustulosus TaxID=76066 RepID=A0AAV7AMG4_ENGPU|nr:hypothetical protein GDO81_015548 [Engystomops pustulosus]
MSPKLKNGTAPKPVKSDDEKTPPSLRNRALPPTPKNLQANAPAADEVDPLYDSPNEIKERQEETHQGDHPRDGSNLTNISQTISKTIPENQAGQKLEVVNPLYASTIEVKVIPSSIGMKSEPPTYETIERTSNSTGEANETTSNPSGEANETTYNPGGETNETTSNPNREANETTSNPGGETNEAKSNPGGETNETTSNPNREANETTSNPIREAIETTSNPIGKASQKDGVSKTRVVNEPIYAVVHKDPSVKKKPPPLTLGEENNIANDQKVDFVPSLHTTQMPQSPSQILDSMLSNLKSKGKKSSPPSKEVITVMVGPEVPPPIPEKLFDIESELEQSTIEDDTKISRDLLA